MEKITFCIPSKNNLRYLKSSIASIKENSSIEHDIIVYVDMSQDGTEEWLIENNITYLKNDTESPKGIAFGYNRCIEAAKTNLVCMFHADMYMGKGFDIAIAKYIKPGTVVSGTRIEPPLHPEGKEKIIKDFGMYPEDFKKEEFEEFISESLKVYKDKTTQGIFAPWTIYKEDIVSIGMHDEHFHSYHEDSDIFNRFILNGYEIVQTWEALVYHLTCRGGQFQDGIEAITKDAQFHLMKTHAAKNYLRKWGSWIQNDEYQYPIIAPKYDIAFAVTNCTSEALAVLEPWCSRIFVENRDGLIGHYIELHKKGSAYDLEKRVHTLDDDDPNHYHDIVVSFDAMKLTPQDFTYIQQLATIIQLNKPEQGVFDLENLRISINSVIETQQELIKI